MSVQTGQATPESRIIRRKDCRACGGVLEDLFSLGTQEVINLGDREPLKAPLDLTFCKSCSLVQLRHTVDKELLFRNYYFRSSANMKEHLKGVMDDVMKRVKLETGDAVVDIGTNDGVFLSFLPDNVQGVGFEPSDTESVKLKPNQTIIRDFFNAKKYEETKL